METFSALLALCARNLPVTGAFHSQRQVTRSFDVFFDLHLNKRLSNDLKAGELRRHRAHYDVIVILLAVSDLRPSRGGRVQCRGGPDSIFMSLVQPWLKLATYSCLPFVCVLFLNGAIVLKVCI